MAILRVPVHHVKDLEGEVERVGVVQAYPLDAAHFRESLHQRGELALAGEVYAVVGEVLGNEHHLLDALIGEPSGLLHQ